jgi:hypothetical protein
MSRLILPLLALLLAAPAAHAQDAWAVLPFQSRKVPGEAAETFRDLLISELGARTGSRFVDAPAVCSDMPCARQAGNKAGAAVAVFGKLSKLGRKIIVTVTAVEVGGGAPLSQQRMSVDRVEDLEAVATRMAQAIVDGENTDQTAQLGAITHKESQPDLRREGESGLALRVGGVSPFGDPYSAGFGIMADIGYWYEATDFAIEPRFGFRTNADSDEEEGYSAYHFDVSANYIFGRGDVAPFFGVGGGLRYVSESRRNPISTGQVIAFESDDLEEDAGWAPGGFARVGLLLFRTYSLRTALTVDYDITFAELHGRSNPQTLNFGISVMF